MKPYVCGICGKEYSLSGALSNHIKSKHGKYGFGDKHLFFDPELRERFEAKNTICMLCGFKAENWRGLQNHITRGHHIRVGEYIYKWYKSQEKHRRRTT